MKTLIRNKTTKRLKNISDFPVSFISAPGGFGKTTSLNIYMSSMNVHCIYFSLFGNTDESWAFSKITSLLSHKIGLSLDSHIPTERRDLDFFTGALEATSDLPVFIILDDVNVATIPTIMKMIQTYSYSPSSMIHFVIITRDSILDQLYSFCKANCFFMDYLDFSLDEEEIASLCKNEDIVLSTSEIHNLFISTKGWISAVQLALQSYKKNNALFSNNSIDSLLKNVLWNTLDNDVRTCLIKLSILNEFTLEQALDFNFNRASIDAILDLEKENFFVQLNGPSTYSIVPIFKDFLHKELLLSNIDIYQLYRNTGDWFHSKRQPLEAITMYLKCNDFDSIIQILDEYKEISFVDIAPSTMMQVYTTIPDEYKAKYPHVYFKWVCDCITNLPQLDGLAMLEDLKHRIDNNQLPGEHNYLLGEYYYIYAFTQFNDVEKMIDNFVIAYDYFNGVTSLAASPLMIATFGSYHVAFLYYNKIGRYRAIVDIILKNIKYYAYISKGINEGSDHQVQAEYAYDTGNFDDVLSHAVRAYNRALKFEQLSVAVASLFVQGRLALMRFDTSAFRIIESKLLEINLINAIPVVRSEIECALAHLHILNNELDKVPAWLQKGDFKHSKILHEAGLIPTIVHGLFLIKTKQYELLHQLANYIEENNPNNMYAYAHLYVTMFKAILAHYYKASNYEAVYFNELLDLCSHDHIISLVVEASFALEPLIQLHVIKSDFEQELITKCLDHNHQLNLKAKSTNLMVNLTKKETKVLAKLSENKKLKEIAYELDISTNTVQTHLKAIYRKLNVNTKIAAIRYYESNLK